MNSKAAEVVIRRMESADLDRVMDIARSLKEAPQWPRGAYETAIDETARPVRVALVGERPEVGIIGFVVAVVITPQAELESIAVAAEAQRKGLGRVLFRSLEREFKARDVTKVQLEVRASNCNALELYRALGFEQTGLRRGYYADPQEDAVQMCLLIG